MFAMKRNASRALAAILVRRSLSTRHFYSRPAPLTAINIQNVCEGENSKKFAIREWNLNNSLKVQTRALSSVRKKEESQESPNDEEEVDKWSATLMKSFFFFTALYCGMKYFPFMGESMIEQSIALLRSKDPLFKRIGASRLARAAKNDKKRLMIMEMGGVLELIKMLKSASDDKTRCEAMKALSMLSECEEVATGLYQSGILSIINSFPEPVDDTDILKYKSNMLRRFHELKFLKDYMDETVDETKVHMVAHHHGEHASDLLLK